MEAEVIMSVVTTSHDALQAPVVEHQLSDAQAVSGPDGAEVLAGMPRNAGLIAQEAVERGWDVRAERRWTGRTWARVVVITGLEMVRAGVEEREHLCAWSEDKGSYLGSASSDGFKAVREAVKGTRPVNREHENTGRTVWGRDAAEWVRQMDGAVSKVSVAFADARDAFNTLDGSTPEGERAVALASAAYSEARDSERSAVDAVTAARAWLAETDGADARGCASWRRVVVLAAQHVKEAAERIADAAARAEREALAAPIITEAQERLNAQEAAWRARLAESGRGPTARGYAGLIVMFEDAARDWCGYFDGYTDYQGQAHAANGDAELSFVAQYDAWKASRNTHDRVSFPSRFTKAALMAGDRVDTAAVAFTLAVAAHIEGRGAERLREAAAAVQKNPQGFDTGNDRKALADWSKYPHISYGEPNQLAEHAPAEWEALQTAQAAYQGVKDFEAALHWDARHAGERAETRSEADETGRQGAQTARAEREASGIAAKEWAAAARRFEDAHARTVGAVRLAGKSVEVAEAACRKAGEGHEGWQFLTWCQEAYGEAARAGRSAAHVADAAQTYREAGHLADYISECARMEDLAKVAEAAAEECRQWDGQAIEEAHDVTVRRQAECATLDAGERPIPATAEVIAFHQMPGVVMRLVCACGAVHGGYVPVRVRGLRGEQAPDLANVTDWDIAAALDGAGLAPEDGPTVWRRGVLVTSHDDGFPVTGFATVVDVVVAGTGAVVTEEPHPDDPPAEAEAYAAVMAECQVQRDAVTRVWSVDRMERGNVPHGNPYAREAAESATADVQPLMSRAAEAEGIAGAAAMVRAEILPALVIAREAVEAYDDHRSEEARVHAMPAATDQIERDERQRPQTLAILRADDENEEAEGGELPPQAPGDDALAPVDAAPLRVYMFNAGAAALWVHVSGPRDEHVSAAEHVATTASVAALRVGSLTDTDADTALVAAGWERFGEWDEDRSAPVRRAATGAETEPVRLALPAAPMRLAIEAAPVNVPGGVVADLEAREAARVVDGLGWSREFADVVRKAAASHLVPESGGKFRALGAAGRRGKLVKAERVRLLWGAGFLARDASGLIVATADGMEALRMVDLAPEALRSEKDVMAAVRKARRARQWDSRDGQDANALPVLPRGGEEARRRAAARRALERWEERAEESRKEAARVRARARIRDRRERRAEEQRRAEGAVACRGCRGVYPVEARCGRCRERAAEGLPLVDFLALPAAAAG
ncbi:hypothetical protein ACWD3I_47045 [Streptomyces sp. NPDC002817]|uniref:hypothetical protein n=1 Tax=Streptomyces sp. NPDC088357 TaxID=3154655 RepID=UPI00343BA87B